eukprot:1192027-Prorocentrum_minimum.AAC.1
MVYACAERYDGWGRGGQDGESALWRAASKGRGGVVSALLRHPQVDANLCSAVRQPVPLRSTRTK